MNLLPTGGPAASIRSLVLLTTLAAGVIACRVDPAEFQARVFTCDPAAEDPACGTDEAGRAMSCFAGKQIGGTNFCAKQCDDLTTVDESHACLSSGIQLDPCHPSEGDAACPRPGLGCFRTDLLKDEGMCTTMNPCTDDSDCRDPVRSVCATTFLASMYEHATRIQRDNLFCLQVGCKERRSACSPGETCLQDVIPAAANPPDICVPNCDSNDDCPPNFLCYGKVSTSIAPRVCIPGLLGFRCLSSIDCMIGDCTDTKLGFNLCTIDCDSDADCQSFDGEQGRFVCVKNEGDPTTPGKCQSPNGYTGSPCATDANCQDLNPDEVCYKPDPRSAVGACLLPCDAGGGCPRRGGIPHSCLPGAQGGPPVCYPSTFGIPCAMGGDCVTSLSCRPTGATPPSLCSIACQSSSDCEGNRWIGHDGWCEPNTKTCLPKLADGLECPAGEACSSGLCEDTVDAGGRVTKRCASGSGAP